MIDASISDENDDDFSDELLKLASFLFFPANLTRPADGLDKEGKRAVYEDGEVASDCEAESSPNWARGEAEMSQEEEDVTGCHFGDALLFVCVGPG